MLKLIIFRPAICQVSVNCLGFNDNYIIVYTKYPDIKDPYQQSPRSGLIILCIFVNTEF